MSAAKLPDLHPEELFAALAEHAVQFLVVGGIGAQLHGAARQTLGLDVCVPWATANFERLAAALNDLGARLDLVGLATAARVTSAFGHLERCIRYPSK